ncbi:MAG: discoidin domain-containing protein, partial [Clostridia bacterium]|nr:discoidin domain-containing protein [Clostridia bacterium]
TVSSFEIAFKEHISEYEIQVSTDGKNFVSVYNLTGGAEQVTQTDKITLTTPVMARYVKYIQKKRWFYAPWNKYYSGGIFEFCVFSDSNAQGTQKYTNIIGTAKTFLANTPSSDARYANVLKYSEQLEAYIKMPNAQIKVADGLYEAIENAINSEAEINLAYQKSYTTTGTYTVNGVVQYPDKNGNSMTDGALAPSDAKYNHEAYMAFNKNSDDYKNDNYASLTVDLGENYFMDKFVAYVASAFNSSVGIEAPSKVSVFVSADNENWTEAGSVTPEDVTNVSCIAANIELDKSVYGRYVQFRFESNVSWIFLSEVCAYEGEAYELPVEPEYILGDVDNNKTVDSVDYLLVKRACFKTYTLSSDEYTRANVNRDSLIDSTDYLLVKRIAFGTYTAE